MVVENEISKFFSDCPKKNIFRLFGLKIKGYGGVSKKWDIFLKIAFMKRGVNYEVM